VGNGEGLRIDEMHALGKRDGLSSTGEASTFIGTLRNCQVISGKTAALAPKPPHLIASLSL